MYKAETKLQAFGLFLQDYTPQEIAKKLNISSANTVRSWAEKKDSKTKKSWKDLKREIVQSTQLQIQKRNESILIETRGKVKKLADSLYDQLIAENAPRIKSAEGGAYAYKNLVEFLMRLEEKQNESSPVVLIQILFSIFEDIPEVARVIQKHWNTITKEINIRLLGSNDEFRK